MMSSLERGSAVEAAGIVRPICVIGPLPELPPLVLPLLVLPELPPLEPLVLPELVLPLDPPPALPLLLFEPLPDPQAAADGAHLLPSESAKPYVSVRSRPRATTRPLVVNPTRVQGRTTSLIRSDQLTIKPTG
jgi:hypothetical protein